MTDPNVEGKIEAIVGYGDDPEHISAVPLRAYIQRPWRLFLTGARSIGNYALASGTILIDLVPETSALYLAYSTLTGDADAHSWGEAYAWGSADLCWGGVESLHYVEPTFDLGEILYISPDSQDIKVESGSKHESQVWTQTGGIMRGHPAQWWVSYMPSHIVDYGFSSASSKTRMGDLSGTTSAEIAPHGTANVRTKGGI